MSDFETLVSRLEESPEDWDTRLDIVHAYAHAGMMDEAHQVLASAPEHAEPNAAQVHRIESLTGEPWHQNGHVQVAHAVQVYEDSEEEAVEAHPVAVAEEEDPAPVSPAEGEEPVVPIGHAVKLRPPGAGEADEDAVVPLTSSVAIQADGTEGEELTAAGVTAPDAAYGQEEEEADEGLTVWQWWRPKDRQNSAAQKVSALTLALIAHIGLGALLTVFIISVPRKEPPQIVASVQPLSQENILEEQQVQKVMKTTPSSAAAQPTFAIASQAASNITVPEFDKTEVLDVTTGVTGLSVGSGLSFGAEGALSEVNFFGIKSAGERIAFIIDAEKYMLEDKKGGIPAYTKVKDEIGQMLAGLNRGTAFNILMYEDKRVSTFRDELVAATPSNVRLAIDWMSPINTVYENLGIGKDGYNSWAVKSQAEPIQFKDLSGYSKAIQAAFEMDVNAVFVICSGWRNYSKSYSKEEREKFEKKTEREWGPKEQEAWNKATAKAKDWLKKENQKRKEKGIPPKVVASMGGIIRQLTPGVKSKPNLPNYGPDHVEDYTRNLVTLLYRQQNKPRPELHIVLFLGEDENDVRYEDHFQNLARRNSGRFKVLQGMAALQNVTER